MPRRADMLAGFFGATLGGVGVAIEGGGIRAVVAAALLGAVLCLSRAHPPVAWVAACGAMLVLAPDTHGLMAFVLWLLVMAHAFAAGRWGGRWWGIAGLVALTGSLLAGAWISGDAGMPAFLLPVTTWAAGRALADRERIAERLAERARELEAERDAHAYLSVRYERAWIAAELHDIVAHALSVMVIQAGAGQRLVSVDRELTTETFESIAIAARDAEADMGRLVALLADAPGIATDLPLVEELVARAAGSGLDVSLRLEGNRDSLAPEVTHLAYRVVQEGLTNALRHASGSSVAVRLRGDSTELLVEVVNGPQTNALPPLTDSGTSNGLRGLHERIGACGGSFEAGPQSDGGWRLAAHLPRRARSTQPERGLQSRWHAARSHEQTPRAASTP